MGLTFFDQSVKRYPKKMVYRDNSVEHEISKVIYVDGNRNMHQIWPCRANLTNLYVVEIRDTNVQNDRISVAYTNTQGNNPNITLLPGHNYTIKGDIDLFDDTGTKIDTLQNCYFFGETIEPVDPFGTVHLQNASITKGNRLATRQSTGQTVHNSWDSYLVWTCDTDPGVDSGYIIQAGFYVPTEDIGYVQLGYIFDPNYQTPLVFKRATITQMMQLAKSSNVTANSSSSDFYTSQVQINDNSPITIYPKYRKMATATGWNNIPALTDWVSLETAEDLTMSNVTYNSSEYTIAYNSSNHSFTVTPLFSDVGTMHDIVFSNGSESYTIQFYKVSNTSAYRFHTDGAIVTGSVNVNGSKNLSFYTPDLQTVYNGNDYTITSSDPSIISVTGKTLLTNMDATVGQTVTISGTIEGDTVPGFTAVVSGKQVHYRIDKVETINGNDVTTTGSVNAWDPSNSNPYTYTWNGYSNTRLIISFARDYGFTIPLTVYGSVSIQPFYGDFTTGFIISGNAQQGNSINIPVYRDSNLQESIGSITITLGTQ